MSLTSYAIGHLRMIEIEKKFEKVIAHHPKRKSYDVHWNINKARDSAMIQRSNFQDYLDHYIRSTK